MPSRWWCPSLPGYTLSFTPNQPRKGAAEIGAMFDTLMRARATRYGAQGGDWGSFVTVGWAQQAERHGIHLNMLPLRRRRGDVRQTCRKPRKVTSANLEHFPRRRSATSGSGAPANPRLRSLGLTRRHGGVDRRRNTAPDRLRRRPRNVLTMDEMLGNISLYWFTNCIGASWPY